MALPTPGLYLPDSVDIWVPSRPVLDDRTLADVDYALLAAGVACYLEPMSAQDRLAVFGHLDMRARHVWLPTAYAQPQSVGGVAGAPLPAGSVFYQAARGLCWLLREPLDAFDALPAAAHAEGQTRHLTVAPPALAAHYEI